MSKDHHSHLWPGVPLALASAMLFGVSAPLSKLLLGTVAPQLLAGLLYLGAGIGLAIVHLGRTVLGLPAPEAPLRRADLPMLGAVVLFGGIIGPLLLMLGLNQTSASSGSLLLNLEGLATMGIAWLVFRENVDKRLLLGAFAIVAGAMVLSWNGHAFRFNVGAGLIAAACVAWGIDNNLTRKLSSADPVVTTMIKGLVAGGVNVSLALLSGSALPSSGPMGAAALVGFLGVGVSLVLDEFLGRLGNDGVAVIIEPVYQRTDRRIFLIFDDGGVIECPHQRAAVLKFLEKPLVIDVEAKCLGS